MKLSVVGNTNIDHICVVEKFPTDNEPNMDLDAREIYLGGGGSNVARVAAKLGCQTSLVSVVGNDFPEEYENELKSDNVNTSFFRRLHDCFTGVCWVITDRRNRQISFVDHKVNNGFELSKDMFSDTDIVHIALINSTVALKTVELFDGDVSFDPSQQIYNHTKEELQALLGKSKFFFGNDLEASHVVRMFRLEDYEGILTLGPKVVIVTLGEKGSLLITKEGTKKIPAVKADSVEDPTGAGDSYRGGFFAALDKGYDYEKACKIGASVASFVVEKKGTQTNIPSWDDVIERLDS